MGRLEVALVLHEDFDGVVDPRGLDLEDAAAREEKVDDLPGAVGVARRPRVESGNLDAVDAVAVLIVLAFAALGVVLLWPRDRVAAFVSRTTHVHCMQCYGDHFVPNDHVMAAIEGKAATTFWFRDESDDVSPFPICAAGWEIERPGPPCACGGQRLFVGKRDLQASRRGKVPRG